MPKFLAGALAPYYTDVLSSEHLQIAWESASVSKVELTAGEGGLPCPVLWGVGELHE